MKIISPIITPMPRPTPEGMFDPMPEVVAMFEDRSSKACSRSFPTRSRSSRPSSQDDHLNPGMTTDPSGNFCLIMNLRVVPESVTEDAACKSPATAIAA